MLAMVDLNRPHLASATYRKASDVESGLSPEFLEQVESVSDEDFLFVPLLISFMRVSLASNSATLVARSTSFGRLSANEKPKCTANPPTERELLRSC